MRTTKRTRTTNMSKNLQASSSVFGFVHLVVVVGVVFLVLFLLFVVATA